MYIGYTQTIFNVELVQNPSLNSLLKSLLKSPKLLKQKKKKVVNNRLTVKIDSIFVPQFFIFSVLTNTYKALVNILFYTSCVTLPWLDMSFHDFLYYYYVGNNASVFFYTDLLILEDRNLDQFTIPNIYVFMEIILKII